MLLFIDSCIREKASRTKELCEIFLAAYAGCCPAERIETVGLSAGQFSCMGNSEIMEREALVAGQDLSHPMFDAAKQFAAADTILIGAPYWDFSFPAALKCYIENVCVKGITFRYNDLEGLVGLCRANRLLYISTAGGKIEGANSGFEYIKELGGALLGVSGFEYVAAEELDIVGADVSAIMEGKKAELLKIAERYGGKA